MSMRMNEFRSLPWLADEKPFYDLISEKLHNLVLPLIVKLNSKFPNIQDFVCQILFPGKNFAHF